MEFFLGGILELTTKEDIKAKLSMIGLDLDKMPKFLIDTKPVVFNPSRLNSDKELKVYKYVSVKDIELYVTNSHRDDPIKEKYNNSMRFVDFIKQSEQDNEKSLQLINLFNTISKESIEKIEEEQNALQNKPPFLVHYNKSQLWQVYYSQDSDKYFMLVPLKEESFNQFFYLLKKKLELQKSKKDFKIYIPISYVNYSEEFLTNRQINDIENYLWVFTKNWSLTYEVHDLNEICSLQIVGETSVYDCLKSMYKIVLNTKEEAEEFYKFIKALFIIQTELGNRYKFNIAINSEDSVDFYYEGEKIVYTDLPDFIKKEFVATETKIKQYNYESNDLEKKLKALKETAKQKDAEYFMKQKEISTYLECRKTFLGKVRYFFSKKKKYAENEVPKDVEHLEETQEKEPKPVIVGSDDKKYHTIDDLVTIQALYERSERYVKDLNQDIRALEIKIENTSKKIENANLYIKEIDDHKKSIFEFWKFANKDEALGLEAGDEQTIKADGINLKKKFDFEYDFEDLGIAQDKLQRTKFSKQEFDSLYLATTNVLPELNMLKNNEMDKAVLESLLSNLKREYVNTEAEATSEFDIFGGMKEDSTQIRYLNNKSHRENEKNKFMILDINKKIDIFDFTEKLQMYAGLLRETVCKVQSSYDMPLYKILPVNSKLNKTDYSLYNINVEREIDSYQNKFENSVKLIKINIKEGMPLVYLTNSVYYDNLNNTLPAGMDVSTQVLIDSKMYTFDLVNKTKINSNRYFNDIDELYPKMITIYLEEYNIELKGDTEDDKEEIDEDKKAEEKINNKEEKQPKKIKTTKSVKTEKIVEIEKKEEKKPAKRGRPRKSEKKGE